MSNIFIFWLQVLEPIVELYHFKKYKNVKKNIKYFVDVDGLFYVCKMVEIHHKKNSITSLIFNLNFQKNWIWLIIILKIKIKKFQINLMLELFMCLMLDMQFQIFKKPLKFNF